VLRSVRFDATPQARLIRGLLVMERRDVVNENLRAMVRNIIAISSCRNP
jgi:hypothetical protein